MSEGIPKYSSERGPAIEEDAAELLHSDQELSSEKQEAALQTVLSNPQLCTFVLGDQPYRDRFTEKQMERLFERILADNDESYVFYTNLTECGVELNEIEKDWLRRLYEAWGQE